MAKVIKVKSWKDLMNLPKEGICQVQFKNGDVAEFRVVGQTQPQLNEINNRYDRLKPVKPTKMIRPDKNARPITIEITEGEEYEQYLIKDKDIENKRAGVITISFLPEELRPDVDMARFPAEKDEDYKYRILEMQAAELFKYVTVGTFAKISEAGMEASNINVTVDEQIEIAKNS
jgi:hypothetical protein